MKNLLSIFDYSGNWSKPYKDNGFNVIQIDIKLGIDIFTWDYKKYPKDYFYGILATAPCTHFSCSGAAFFFEKDRDGRTYEMMAVVYKMLAIIQYFDVKFWVVKNPISRIAKLVPELEDIIFKFDPTDFAGYCEEPEKNRYNKKTWLWGQFKKPKLKRLEPLMTGSENRSITLKGFALAFYKFNH